MRLYLFAYEICRFYPTPHYCYITVTFQCEAGYKSIKIILQYLQKMTINIKSYVYNNLCKKSQTIKLWRCFYVQYGYGARRGANGRVEERRAERKEKIWYRTERLRFIDKGFGDIFLKSDVD